MSYSSGKRYSGGKGFSGSKKPKKKKQAFHERKLRSTEETKPSIEELKQRLIIALDKLGHQVFSAEPWGYGRENWVKNFNSLLDEFEESVGRDKLPAEYVTVRAKADASLSKPVDTSQVDEKIEGIKRNEEELRSNLEEERKRLDARLEELLRTQVSTSAEIAENRKRAVEVSAKYSAPQPFFKRLFGKPSPSASEDGEKRLLELESALEALKKGSAEVERTRRFVIERDVSPDSPFKEKKLALESLRAELANLETEKLEILGLSRERELVTKEMVAVIAKLSSDGEKDGGAEPTSETQAQTKDA